MKSAKIVLMKKFHMAGTSCSSYLVISNNKCVATVIKRHNNDWRITDGPLFETTAERTQSADEIYTKRSDVVEAVRKMLFLQDL